MRSFGHGYRGVDPGPTPPNTPPSTLPFRPTRQGRSIADLQLDDVWAAQERRENKNLNGPTDDPTASGPELLLEG